jgi:hypothetical protein
MQRGVVDMKVTGKVAALALAATLAAHPAQACWTNAEADAAKLANLNMMMMVSALRCRNGQDNFLNEYNRFVKSNNAMLGAQNATMKNHFARMNGAKSAESAMDKYVISLANHYGSGHESMGCAELKSVAGDMAAKSHSAGSLLEIAERSAERLPLPGGNCPVTIAAK